MEGGKDGGMKPGGDQQPLKVHGSERSIIVASIK